MQHELMRPFEVSRLHWRVGATNLDKQGNPKWGGEAKGRALAYIDARDVMKRLDDVCGFGGWQNRYTLADSGLLICEIGIKINDEWVWRANGAGDTQVEAEKGKASDAFKRAAVMWGIGRYLYSLDSPWLPLNQYKQFDREHIAAIKLPKWATPEGYDEMVGVAA